MILRSGIGSIQNSTISQLAHWSQSVHWNFITGVPYDFDSQGTEANTMLCMSHGQT